MQQTTISGKHYERLTVNLFTYQLEILEKLRKEAPETAYANTSSVFRTIIDKQCQSYLYRTNQYVCGPCGRVQSRENLKCQNCGAKWKEEIFTCQGCAEPKKSKERHEIPVAQEVFVFGDCCFFSNHYKEIIRQII